MKHLIADAHEDLAYNIVSFNRDYTLPMEETRRREEGSSVVEHNGETLLGWREFQQGKVAFIFSTIFAAPFRGEKSKWDSQIYSTPDEAHQLYMKQIDIYDRLFDKHPDKFTPIRNINQFEHTLSEWESSEANPATGLITLMEGAEGVRHPDELEEWWERGVRVIGPAWKSTRFCGGTREPGPLTREGHDLLRAMAPIGFTLDLSHMAWEAALEALDLYDGPIIASHANAVKQVKNGTLNRFLTDEIIDGIIQRNGVIGVIPYNNFLIEGWTPEDTRDIVPLDMVAAQMDYICQRAGNANHVGLGTDFDGGFGLEKVPFGINSIADLQDLTPLLESRGHSETDISKIMGYNWIELLRRTLRK